MAATTIPFKQSSYFKLHSGVDQFLLERIIFPEFERQSRLGKGSEGIELPVGTNQPPEHISLDEARQLILDYLINTKNLGEKDQTTLSRVGSYEEFIKYAYGLYQRRIEDTKSLATAARLENLGQLQKSKTAPAVVDNRRFNSDARIREYNELYLKLLKTSSLGSPAKTLSLLFRNGITTSTNVNQLMLAQVIAENLPRLYKAGSLGTSPEAQDHAVATELRYLIAKSHPELSSFTNLLGDNQVKASLRAATLAMGNSALKQDPKIFQKFETAQLRASQALATHLLNESELRTKIYNTLPIGTAKERLQLTDEIMREVTKNSLDPKQVKDIIYSLNLQDSQKQTILQSLQSTGIDTSLEYRQGELYILANSRRLTSAEVGLIKRGLNPFLTTQDPASDSFVSKEKKLLSEYNSNPLNQGKTFLTLKEAYEHEAGKSNPDPLFLLHAREHLNRLDYYQSLSGQEKGQVNRARFSRWFTNTRSRAQEIQSELLDTWIDLEETITGKKWLFKQLDKWDKFAENFTVKVGTKDIPIFRLRNWAFDQWAKLKEKTTLNLISKTSSSTSWFGKFTHARLKDYELGGFTLKGASFVILHRAWSGLVYKASAGIVKEGAIFSIKSATRLLIKIGGKALAKAGVELIATVSGVFTAVGILLIVKDVLELAFGVVKWAWNSLKKIIPDSGAIVAGAVTAIAATWAAGFGFVLSLLAPLVMPGIISLGAFLALIFVPIYYQDLMTNTTLTTVRLDVGSSLQEAVVSLVCNQAGGGEGNSTANVALCIADIVAKCPGVNPIRAATVKSPSWQCVVSGLVFKSAVSELVLSSTVVDPRIGSGAVQCVGLSAAAASGAGSAFSTGQRNACTYATTNKPAGYTYLPGCPNMQPGDHFITGVSDCGGGNVGHIGVVIDPNQGEKFTCVDANFSSPGQIRGPDTCYFAKSQISGCLRKM